jgi:hypothetical protein
MARFLCFPSPVRAAAPFEFSQGVLTDSLQAFTAARVHHRINAQ